MDSDRFLRVILAVFILVGGVLLMVAIGIGLGILG